MSAPVRLLGREARWIGCSLLAFTLLALDVVTSGLVVQLDERLREQLAGHSVAMESWTQLASKLGDIGVAVAVLAIASAASAQVLWRIWPVAVTAITFVFTQSVVYVTKSLVGRPGPGIWADREGYPGYYPAGHTTTAAITAGLVVFLAVTSWRRDTQTPVVARLSLWAGLLIGAAAGLNAVLDDSHWVSDIVGGLLLATCILLVAFAACRTRLPQAITSGSTSKTVGGSG
ncbi:MAG: phosphatase PAP2 family protein [Nocardioidaceae bacterium]